MGKKNLLLKSVKNVKNKGSFFQKKQKNKIKIFER